ncbi:hypothetical protein DOTSEDRAFT_72358 [Dothistroma septosporum NZE10]|uniref:Uncharacterized protein n=1 Tax=Dothistroma septosporum (strain NZE10 / CBS 128990) TaxID=675120 RepID=M2WLK3_DOTSN|nr:hypothetical protein DOTSEDRAFT_72358 [Dothistroma septosporum NZE10]
MSRRHISPDTPTSFRHRGLHDGILRNVFLYYDKDSIDSVLLPTGFYDDMWCYAIGPDFEDDSEEYVGEDSGEIHPGYFKVRTQQFVNRFFEARKYHEESLSMERLWWQHKG